jgi:hypothetical protein
VLRSLSEFIFGTMGYAAPALVLVAIFIHPSGKAVRDSWFAMGPARRSATLLFGTPLVLPIVLGLVKHINLLSIWNEPSLNLLPVMMLASPIVVVSRATVMRIAAVVTAGTLIVVAPSQTRRRERRRLCQARRDRDRRSVARGQQHAAASDRRSIRAGEFCSLLRGRQAFDLLELFRLSVALGDGPTHRRRGYGHNLPSGRPGLS